MVLLLCDLLPYIYLFILYRYVVYTQHWYVCDTNDCLGD